MVDSRCPDPDPKLSEVVIEPWQNFSGEHADYSARLEAAGVGMAPRHARIVLSHGCGWSVATRAGPQSATRVLAKIVEHLGSTVVTNAQEATN